MNNETVPSGIDVGWEDPDLLLLRYKGQVTVAHVEQAVAESLRRIGLREYHVALIDVGQLVGLTAEARKVATSSREKANIRGVAVIGASFHLKVLGNLMDRAARLVYRAKDNPFEFFGSEAEARVWLEERRRVLAKEYRKT